MASAAILAPQPAPIHGIAEKLPETALTSGPVAWKGCDLNVSDYVIKLTSEDSAEVTAAVLKFRAQGTKLGHLGPDTFPLPTLGAKVRDASCHHLHAGVGFFVVRGLKPQDMLQIENAIAFLGIASHVANRRGQQSEGGPVMTHIYDYSSEIKEMEKINGGYLGHANRTSALPFHNDKGDIAGMYCLKGVQVGGHTKLASVSAIYNELAKTDPETINVLKEEWLWDTFDKNNPGLKMPLLYEEGNRVIGNYRVRPFVGSPGYPRNPALGELPEHHSETLLKVEQVAKKLQISFPLETGDILFVNNFSILHARDEFTPAGDPSERRHLFRGAFQDDKLKWWLPDGMREENQKMFAHNPEGEVAQIDVKPLSYMIGQ